METKQTETMKKRKRNLKLAGGKSIKSSKKHRIVEPERVEEVESEENSEPKLPTNDFDEGLPWKNLELVLSIENKDLDINQKMELAFDFVSSKATKESNDDHENFETVKMSRVVIFLNDWVQSLLISSKTRIGFEAKPNSQVNGTYLDFRCWKIFKFCLEESAKSQASLSFSKNILESIRFLAEDTLSELNNMSSSDMDLYFARDEFELNRTSLDCIGLLFSSHNGLSNESLGLWISTVNAVIKLVQKVNAERIENGYPGLYSLKLSCFVLEPFARFLRANPTHKKNGFHDFVQKLLEPLLDLLGILNREIDGVFYADWKSKLSSLVEDVLSFGLFHPVQIDGFFGLNSTEKYIMTQDGENGKDSKTIIKSYHRHLFAKLEEIMAVKKEFASNSIGKLISLLASRLKSLKGALILVSENTNTTKKTESLSSTSLTSEKRKSLFDFFVLIMEPLLLETNGYLELEQGIGPILPDVHCTLKSINSLLASFMYEKIYLRTEDTSDGACINFLKKVYDSIVSLSASLITSSSSSPKEIEVLASSAKEVLIAIGYLIEIDYAVIGSDLTSLWLLVLSFLGLEPPLTHEANQFSLFSKIAEIGSQLFDLYRQLRQVSNAIFTLCKAIRLSISHDGVSEVNQTRFSAPLPDEARVRSVGMLLCSEGFMLSIQKAVKSTPEGQSSSCLQQLATDISESLEWVKTRDLVSDENGRGDLYLGNRFDLQAGLMGRGLSEVYGLVLNSLPVTTGNSYLVGKSLKDLVTVLSPCMSHLVGVEPDVINKFLFSATKNGSYDDRESQSFEFSSHWVFVFFFQLYMSCRALYRQASSLMPPDSSKKISSAMGDSFTALSGQDWTQLTDWKNFGYFSCFNGSSVSLDIVFRAVSSVYVQASSDGDCPPLIYVMNSMALQRVVDLNRQIKSLKYLLQNNECLVQIRSLDDEDLSQYRKKGKMLEKRISILSKEATELTNFMMECLSVVAKNQQPISTLDEWDFSFSSVDKKSLPIAIWWILCQNIDVWSIHAPKKELKTFLSLLIRTSIPFGKSSSGQVEDHKSYETKQQNRVTMWEISLELFNNSILYEQRFVCRHLASRFCHALEESTSTFTSSSSKKVDIMSPPDWAEVLSDLENSSPTFSSNRNQPKTSSLTSVKVTAPQSLLNLLSWIPKGFFDSKSFSLLLTSILNLERLVISSLLDGHDTLSSLRVNELFRLFMSCRKVLKYIIMASCEKTESTQTAVSLMYSEKSMPVIWLFKSLFVVVNIQSSFPKEISSQMDDTIFSLLDHTLYVFLTLEKYHFDCSVNSICDSDDSCEREKNDLAKSWRSVSRVAKSLKEQMRSSVVLLKGVVASDEKAAVENLNNFSSVVACFSGFLWGLLSVIKQTDAKSDEPNMVLSGWKDKPNSEINLCINVFEELSGLLLGIVYDMDRTDMNGFVDKSNGDQDDSGALRSCSKKFKSTGSKSVASFLTGVDSLKELPLNKPLLRNLLKGDCPKSAFLLRELFMASSGVLGLKLHVNCAPLSSSLLRSLTGLSQALLSEFADSVETPKASSLVWLDGAVKYLEELGNHFPMTDPKLSGDLYVKMVELQLKAIGKCIALEGKKATLESHETESSTKLLLLSGDSGLSEGRGLDEIKSRLRISFSVFIKKASEFHLLSAIKAIERALVGVRERSAMIYEIETGSENGGKVSSVVAAAIDCLDLVLESVSGPKRLNVVKRHIQSLIASSFNVILHLQSPLIFYKRSIGNSDPDSGAVILMCVEVLKRISGKHALYQMESWHVAQSLLIPGALFRNFNRLRVSGTFTPTVSNEQIDRRFSIDLFAACCRLLYNVLKHHKSELKRSIAVLESSVSVLLHCLETMNSDSMVKSGYFSWEVEEGVQCAYCLRRIYEEIRHQKEILGRHCSQFLSNYVWVYSGYGPLKTGIKREIDEALRPGVYALIDACSTSDLQHLHTVFGEGPCRSTLATLRHDYKLNFQFEGKV